ncbi:MAG: hypothetical protein LUQ71_05255 [Methanoregula sp.]|nr:hypothetical protein [Methanoregula sp.]
MLAITIILAALVLLTAFQVPNLWHEPEIPTVFEITNIKHLQENGVDYDSYMIVKNIGKTAYDNRNLYAKTYRNGIHLSCDIPTMNGNDFLPTHHYGIQNMRGFGSHDFLWSPDATIGINYAKGTFHPGDIVQFEVYDKDTHQIISRDTYPHAEETNQEKMMRLYLNRQVA